MTGSDVAAFGTLILGLGLLVAPSCIAPLLVSVLRSPFLLATVGAGTWAVAASLLHLLRPEGPTTLLLAAGQIVGAWAVLVAGLWTAMIVSYRGHLLTMRSRVLVWVPPAVVVAMLAVPSLSPLVVIGPSPDRSSVEWGAVFWTVTTCAVLLAGIVAAVGLTAVAATVPGQRPALLVAMGALAPAAASLVLYLVAPNLRSWATVPPAMFCLAFLAWGVLGVRVPSLTQLPITAARVLAEVRDGVVVLTPDGIVLDTNAAARDLLCRTGVGDGSALVGRSWREVTDAAIADLPTARRTLTVTNACGREVELLVDDSDGGGPSAALVVAARDVTELSELRRHLAEVATHDPMTGARNRRYLDDRLPALVTGGDLPFSVVMLDIDLFKAVNDTFGHAVGDRVIIAVADVAGAALPEGGDLVRTGGDEFLLLLPGHDAVGAGRLADAVRRRCAELRFALHDTQVQVTVSAGVATMRPGLDGDGLLAAADRALYRAKLAGRDITRG